MEVMARYHGGGAAAADVAWKMGRIMLKYRPIAPKPVCGGAVAAGPVEAKSSGRRGKRKGCMKEGRRGRRSAKKMAAAAAAVEEAGAFREEQEKNNSVVTLPLMPVTPERKESTATPTPSPTASGGPVAWQQVGTTTSASGSSCSSSNNNCSNISSPSSPSVVVAPRPVRAVGSWVTVEGVTDAWGEGGVHVSPVAYAALLEGDTSPVLISDACGQVTWTNAAYKQMVVGPSEEDDEQEEEEVMRVALVTKGMVPAGAMCFTCMVRVRYACKRRGGKVSMAAPCDVWRLADGRLVWRLDVAAALSLSSVGS